MLVSGMSPRLPAFFLLACMIAVAQSPAPRSSVQGAVTDVAGLPLAGVEVELLSLATGRIRSIETDAAGRFSFTDLDTGRYSLTFFLDGYAAVKLPPRELLPGSPVDLSVRLERLGPLLARATSGMQSIALEYGLVREQITAAPILLGSEGRTAVDKLALLVPGLTPVEALEVDPFSGVAATTSANGSRPSAINYQFDGAANNAQNRLTGAQAATYAPTPEAVETFRAVTHTFSARDGRNAGAVLSTVSRSGAAAWHGQLRGIVRPFQSPLESFNGSSDSLGGWAGGGQVGGPLWPKRKLYLFADAEGWSTTQRHTQTTSVFSLAERAGDLSGLGQPVLDPDSGNPGSPFPDNVIPTNRLDPLMQKYLATFVPEPNIGLDQARSLDELASDGKTLLGRLDFKPGAWSISASHLFYRSDVETPIGDEVLAPSPGVADSRRQLANNFQISLTWAPDARFTQTTRAAGQRLSIARRQGRPDFQTVTADEFGFDFASFGFEPGTIPDVKLYDDQGFVRMHIAPFLSSENSAQTTYQLSHDVEYRVGSNVFRGGVLYQRGQWPFTKTDNFAGSFSFPLPPEPPIRSRPNGLRDLLLGLPGEYRLQTPRALNLRWRELAVYGEAELQPLRTLRITLGLRAEAQPPAVDTLDRFGAFRQGQQSARFPDAPPNLIFPGDMDGDLGPLPRATVDSRGFNLGPRIGVAFSSGSDKRIARWLLGESGRSVLRASYGLFYDFGAFAGSSTESLFQTNYPPFSSDNRFDFTRAVDGFRQPFAGIPGADPAEFVPTVIRYPLLVFDRDYQNARAHQWNLGFQRVVPGGVFLSAIYVGSRSLRLQRQRELNEFIRNPLRGFAFVRSMRRFSRFTDVRQFESTGSGRYNGLQLRANRYLRRGIAFDVSYSWSRSDDNSSQLFGEELISEPWTVSNFDRRQNLTAAWTWEARIPRSWSDRYPWFDRWTLAGVLRVRSGLPLDVRQNEDPTFTFLNVGRPDVFAPFRPLDPSEIRTFTLADGRTVTGRFAFDPTPFRAVEPADFDETRAGNIGRNAFRMRGYRQWDLRVARPFAVTEDLSMQLGFDLINVLGARNWDAPFANIDHPSFGIVRTEGVRRTFQAVVRVEF